MTIEVATVCDLSLTALGEDQGEDGISAMRRDNDLRAQRLITSRDVMGFMGGVAFTLGLIAQSVAIAKEWRAESERLHQPMVSGEDRTLALIKGPRI